MHATRSIGRSLRSLSCPRCLAKQGGASSLLASSSRTSRFAQTPSLSVTTSGSIESSRRYINTISPDEVSHFSSLSQTWWNEKGDFNVLQRMNKVRVQFLKERLKMVKRYEENSSLNDLLEIDGPFPLKGMKVLDVGCGGGLFTERLARLGANTLAVDASEKNVKAAQMHASQDPHLASMLENGTLEYRHAAVEDLLAAPTDTTTGPASNTTSTKEQFDIVFAMEVVEHVADPQGFLRCLSEIVKPGGHIILSTISRTPLARLVAISLAESPLIRLAPAGSHTYEKFVRPDELITFFTEELGWPGPSTSSLLSEAPPLDNSGTSNHLGKEQKSLRYDMEVRGTTYLPWKGEWQLFAPDDGKGVIQSLAKSCNYFFGARKPLSA